MLCYYAQYLGNSPLTDTQGHLNGEHEIVYSDPVALYANISPESGRLTTQQFGDDTSYARTIVCDLSVPINENTVFWIGITPRKRINDPYVYWNYVVKGISKSLNSMTIMLKKVNVSG